LSRSWVNQSISLNHPKMTKATFQDVLIDDFIYQVTLVVLPLSPLKCAQSPCWYGRKLNYDSVTAATSWCLCQVLFMSMSRIHDSVRGRYGHRRFAVAYCFHFQRPSVILVSILRVKLSYLTVGTSGKLKVAGRRSGEWRKHKEIPWYEADYLFYETYVHEIYPSQIHRRLEHLEVAQSL
jgi:hypothetical protein